MLRLASSCSLCYRRLDLKLLKIRGRTLTTGGGENEEASTDKKGGFARAFVKHSNIEDPVENEPSFAHLFRHSKFIDMGDPEGRIATGTVFNVVGDDLYIDFGGKFHCVCTRPKKNASEYVRGSKVKLRIKDLELSTRFLGSEKDLTILEADATLLGLVYSPVKSSI